jgi:hypothetical protein
MSHRIHKRTAGKIDRRRFRAPLCACCRDNGFVSKMQVSELARRRSEQGFVLCPKRCPASRTADARRHVAPPGLNA